MIKVECIENDETIKLFFESRTTDNSSLAELDKLYEVLVSNLRLVVLNASYDRSNQFSITLKNK